MDLSQKIKKKNRNKPISRYRLEFSDIDIKINTMSMIM